MANMCTTIQHVFDVEVVSDSVTARMVTDFRSVLALAGQLSDDAARVDLLRALEELKATASGVQMRVAGDLRASQEAEQAARGVPEGRRGRGVPSQIGLALRRSPGQARRFLSLGWVLCTELPATFAVLLAGLTTEFRALTVARESIFLSAEDRARLDQEIAPQLEGLGDRQVEAEARRIAYRLDPGGFVRRSRQAAADRHVSVRPAPDTMTRFSALLPVAAGVALYAELSRAADAARAAGDERSRGQVMADTLVERVTGAGPRETRSVVHLVMTDQSLVGSGAVPPSWDAGAAGKAASRADESGSGTATPSRAARAFGSGSGTGTPGGRVRAAGSGAGAGGPEGSEPEGSAAADEDLMDQVARAEGEAPAEGLRSAPEAGMATRPRRFWDASDAPAEVIGYGPVPAGVARDIVAEAAQAWVRRLWTDPQSGRIERFDVRARRFPKSVRDVVIVRDRFCRTPWCGAPIRHIDHPERYSDGGPTTLEHSQGLCEQCNYAKEDPGWRARVADDGSVVTRTPTGHAYVSAPPRLPLAG